MGSLNIKELAAIAGVSHTTVSRVMNDSPLISDKTKDFILKLARKHGYTPNNFAKSLALKRSFNIGLFFSNLDSGVTSYFYFEIVTGVKRITGSKYHLITHGINEFKGDFSGINSRNYDGIILVSQSRSDSKFIEYIQSIELPMVIVNRDAADIKIDSFYSDEKEAVKKIVLHFHSRGHRKIAILNGPNNSISSMERYNGYKEALTSLYDSNFIPITFQGDYSIESGYKAGLEFLKLKERPSAIFAANDFMAVGFYRAMNENNIKIPEDISIAGFDSSDISAYLSPALTTVKRPVEEIIKYASERLLQVIENKDESLIPVSREIKCEIIFRDSISVLN